MSTNLIPAEEVFMVEGRPPRPHVPRHACMCEVHPVARACTGNDAMPLRELQNEIMETVDRPALGSEATAHAAVPSGNDAARTENMPPPQAR